MKQPKPLNLKMFSDNPARFLEETVKDFVRTSPLNCTVAFGNQRLLLEPVMAFANGDDPVFKSLKKAIGDFHLTPRKALETLPINPKTLGVVGRIGRATSSPPDPSRFKQRLPEHVSVISGALPINPETCLDEGKTIYGGSIRHKLTSWIGGHTGFARTTTIFIENLLMTLGYIAISPSAAPYGEQNWKRAGKTCRTSISNWSERHIGLACGLGTFGLHGQLITPRGAAAYLFSVVTDLQLEPTPKISKKENCLFYRDGSCKKCIDRCQGGAISEKGRDPYKCNEYALNTVIRAPQPTTNLGIFERYRNRPACGLCFTNVPCQSQIP